MKLAHLHGGRESRSPPVLVECGMGVGKGLEGGVVLEVLPAMPVVQENDEVRGNAQRSPAMQGWLQHTLGVLLRGVKRG